jgi:drug/metabolite transporter (DMT)-like permease
MKQKHAVTKLLFIAALLQIVWGIVPSASKFVIDEIPVELYITLRWSISGVIFAIYLLVTKGWRQISVRNIGLVSLLGLLGYGLGSFGTLYGLKVGGVTNFALMGALSPVITSVVAIWVLKERPQRLFYFALPIGVIGLILLIVGKYQISSFAVAGLSATLVIGAYILEALVFVFSKRFKSQMSAIQYLAITQIATAFFMWILQLSVWKQVDQISHLSLNGLLAAVFVSVVACVLCYAVLYWLLEYIDGHRLALFDGFHTLSAVIFGYFLFNETLTPLMIVGGVLILLSLIAGNLPKHIADEDPE